VASGKTFSNVQTSILRTLLRRFGEAASALQERQGLVWLRKPLAPFLVEISKDDE
jgi:hypothetical protein